MERLIKTGDHIFSGAVDEQVSSFLVVSIGGGKQEGLWWGCWLLPKFTIKK